jgi:hypothetical protein
LKTEHFRIASESALGAGGREFESRRPDQQNQADAAMHLGMAKTAVDKFVAAAFLKIQQASSSHARQPQRGYPRAANNTGSDGLQKEVGYGFLRSSIPCRICRRHFRSAASLK